MTLPQLFHHSFQQRRDQAALESDRTYTFGELDARAASLASALAKRGVTAGDRLCVYLPNSIDFIDLFSPRRGSA